MATSKRWVLVVGLSLVLLVLAGMTAWVRRPAEVARSTPAPVSSAALPPAAPVPSQPSSQNAAVIARTEAPAPSAEPPHFDIVRVEPSGETVVAGRGAPNAKIALIVQGAVVAETMTDASGHFVVLPPSLLPGDHALSLRQTPEHAPPSTSAQSVTVVVPQRGKGSVVVALAEPGQATKVLSAPDAPAPAPPAAPRETAAPATAPVVAPPKDPRAAATDAKVAVRAVDLENGDGFHASGVAKPGTPLHLYLNNTHIADVVAGSDGKWTVTIKRGLAGGHYVVRADAEQPADASRKAATVVARAEVPFDVPPPAPRRLPQDVVGATAAPKTVPGSDAPMKEASASPPDARQPDRQRATTIADAGNVVIEEIKTARVVEGDNLWNISLSRLGQAQRYTQIYAANDKQIRDPNLIYPGQVFVLPR